MPTSAELRARLEDNTIRLNAMRTTLKELKRDYDFPHTLQKMLTDSTGVIGRLERELAFAQQNQKLLLQRLDRETNSVRIATLETEICELVDAREALQSQLMDAAATEKVEPHLNKLQSLQAQLLTLPQEQLAAILASLPQQATAQNDSGTSSSVADIAEIGNGSNAAS